MTKAESDIDLRDYACKLWSVELLKGADAFRMEPQLTIPGLLVVCLSGDGMLEREARRSRLIPGTMYFCPEESTYRLIGTGDADADAAASVAVIRFSFFRASAEDGRGRLLAAPAAGVLAGDEASVDGGKLASLCRAMHRHWTSEDAAAPWRAQAELQELISEWQTAQDRDFETSNVRQAMERAKTYIDEHHADNVSIRSLAEMTELSPKYFSELFKKIYGVTATDYLTDVRMKRAKQLLLQPDRLQREVAHAVGYDDEFYFSRKFKRHYGMSPTAYVRKRKRKLALYGSTALLGYALPLHALPYAAPLHPKWSSLYFDRFGSDIPVHLDAYRQNHRKSANLRLLADAAPDLIVSHSMLEDWEREELRGIAPVYELPADEAGWKAQLRSLGDRLEEGEEAERWIAEFDAKAAQLRRDVERSFGGGTVLPLRFLRGRFYAHCNRGIFDVVHDALGIRSPYGDVSSPFDRPVSLGEIESADADRILLLVCQETETLEAWRRLERSPAWVSRSFVQEGRLRRIASEPWREYSPMALERMLEETRTLLAGKSPSSIRRSSMEGEAFILYDQ